MRPFVLKGNVCLGESHASTLVLVHLTGLQENAEAETVDMTF
jgi:hypothetical protein